MCDPNAGNANNVRNSNAGNGGALNNNNANNSNCVAPIETTVRFKYPRRKQYTSRFKESSSLPFMAKKVMPRKHLTRWSC